MTDYMAVDTDLPPYFPYPQFLMDMPLSHTAALTYALLLDRAHLSQLNGWTDEAGWGLPHFPRGEDCGGAETQPFICQERIGRVVGGRAD